MQNGNIEDRSVAGADPEADDGSDLLRLASTTLADLLTPLLVANPFSAVRAFLRWWASDCFEDGVTYRWQGGLRRRSVDSFFPAVLF